MTHFKGTHFQVTTPTHDGHIQFIEDDLLYYNRTDFYDTEKVVIDAFGPTWLLGWTSIDPQIISVYSGLKLHKLSGRYAIYIPRFSIFRWHVYPGQLHWQALVSSSTLPNLDLSSPLVIPISSDFKLHSKGEISQFLIKSALSTDPSIIRVEQQNHHHRLSRLVKEFIDQNFREEISIADVAKYFQENPVILTRNFSRAYGLSPLKYRQRLRLFEAMNLMNHGHSVTDSIFASGFTNLSEFNRQFKQTLNTNPKQFAPCHQAQLINPKEYKVKKPEVSL